MMLKASPRACNAKRSVIRKFRLSARSKLNVPGPVTALRPRFPGVPTGSEVENAAGFRNWTQIAELPQVCEVAYGSGRSWLGRSLPRPVREKSVPEFVLP